MTDRSRLEQLLPELQRQILLHLDSLDTLRALILASPRLFQVYCRNKEVTISAIARRVSHPTAIQDALGIERLKEREHSPFSRSNVLSFFESISDYQRQAQELVLPLPVSLQLCRLDATIRFFIDDYARNTLPILTQLKNSGHASIESQYITNNHDPPHLSKSELNRLRRAFCRFETYRQLFARCSSRLDHNVRPCFQDPSLTVFEQGQQFFQHAPACRVAEIACVRDYLCRRLRGIFDQVEDEAVQLLHAQFPNPNDQQQAMDWDMDTGGRYDYFEDGGSHLFTYGGKFNQNYHIEHLLSLGLPYIQKILNATGDERKALLLRENLIRDCDAQYENHFLTAALGLDALTPTAQRYGWPRRDPDPYLEQKNQLEAPAGWRWAHAHGYYTGLIDGACKGLRDWGYVFWDLDRLQNTGVLDRDPREVRNLKFDEYLASHKPSVQERWMGPPSPDEASDIYEIEDIEEGEEEEGRDGDEGDGEGEDTHTGHAPPSILSLAGRWLRDAGNAILKTVSLLKKRVSLWCSWPTEGFRAVLDRLHTS